MTPQQLAEAWAAWMRAPFIFFNFAMHVAQAEARLAAKGRARK